MGQLIIELSRTTCVSGLGRGINKSSSDDRSGPCISGTKYVEDAKAARSVRVWDVPMKYMG